MSWPEAIRSVLILAAQRMRRRAGLAAELETNIDTTSTTQF